MGKPKGLPYKHYVWVGVDKFEQEMYEMVITRLCPKCGGVMYYDFIEDIEHEICTKCTHKDKGDRQWKL